MNDDKQKILDLCETVSSGNATQQQLVELEAIMSADASARQTFLNWSAMQVDLANSISASLNRESLQEKLLQKPSWTRSFPRSAWLTVLAASIAVLLLAVSSNRSVDTLSNGNDLAQNSSKFKLDGMAVVNRIENVTWSKNARPVGVGELLKSDSWIEIESGVAEIEFGQGAVVVLEGPARFVAKSTSVGLLDHGKLAAVVPPWAEGFRVDTPSIEVVDRGTEFVLEVTADQQVHVGVTKGEVEVWQQQDANRSRAQEPKHRIFAGSAVQATGTDISEVVFDQQWHALSEQLPAKPDHTEVEVVARYRRDFINGMANEPMRDDGWRYYANVSSDVHDATGYRELLWDTRRAVYDPNGDRGLQAGQYLNAANLSYRGGHPGQGRDQCIDDRDHFVIAAFQVPKEGLYGIKSGWLVRAESREDVPNQAVDLRVWVNSNPAMIEETCSRDGLLQFQENMGELRAGDIIYVAVGPRSLSYNDRFEWDFAIVRDITSIAL